MNGNDHLRICREARELFEVKNAQYGSSIDTEGLLGSAYHLRGFAVRLGALVIRADDSEIEVNRARLEDIFLDMVNYSVIGLHMLRSGNWRGVDGDLELDDQE